MWKSQRKKIQESCSFDYNEFCQICSQPWIYHCIARGHHRSSFFSKSSMNLRFSRAKTPKSVILLMFVRLLVPVVNVVKKIYYISYIFQSDFWSSKKSSGLEHTYHAHRKGRSPPTNDVTNVNDRFMADKTTNFWCRKSFPTFTTRWRGRPPRDTVHFFNISSGVPPKAFGAPQIYRIIFF